MLSESEPDRLVAAKGATPIVLGLGDGGDFVASDIPAARPHRPDGRIGAELRAA